jgi:hypothetical protein
VQDQYNKVNRQNLGCTANDVRVAKVINVRNPDGSARASCIGGSSFSFVADFLVETTSKSSRSNIGLYFSEFDASVQPTALTGSCSDNIIAPPHKSSDSTSTNGVTACLGSGASLDATCTGFGTYEEADGPAEATSCNSGTGCTDKPTGCGDTSSTDAAVCLDANNNVVNCTSNTVTQKFPSTQIVTVEIKDFACPSEAAGTQLMLPNCTSWQVPGSTITCIASPQDYIYPFNGPGGTPTAIPGSPSKCNCAVIPLPIIVQTPTVQVQKACTTTNTSGPATFNISADTETPTSCDAGPEGGQTVNYTVKITNLSATGTGGITFDQICDSEYGTLYRSATFTGPFCNGAATQPPFTGNSNSGCDTLDPAAQATATCTFTAIPNQENLVLAPGSPSLSDTVTVYGHGDLSHTSFTPTTSNTVTVTSGDAPSSAKTTPAPSSITQACATERYTATVQNTSAADETIFITGLHDSTPLDLTTLSTSIVGTTCGVSATANSGNGLGTLGTTPANPFPTVGIAPGTGTPPTNGGTYTCSFDVFFCATPSPVEQFGTGVCGTNGFCSQGQPSSMACTTNSQCDSSCNGITHSETLSATLTGDDTSPADIISPVVNKTGTVDVCVQTSSSVN